MVDAPHLSDAQLTPAGVADMASGLLGFVQLHYGLLVLDGITLRRTVDGRHALSFPGRRDRRGVMRSIMRPADDAARRELEGQVFRALGLEERAR